jgi:cytochrome c oxidase subunit 2
MLTTNRRCLRLLGLVLLGVLVALLIGCTPSHPQSTFNTLGPVARSQAVLFYIIFWVGLFVFIAVEAAIIYAVIRFRRKSGQGDPEQIHGNDRLEVAWTIVPAIILILVAIPSIMTIFHNANSPRTPEEGGLLVEVIGHQWWFEFRYPEHNVVTANELHIPVDEVVNISLDSVDVLHSFWVPWIAGKVDMVPGNINQMWIQADEAGVFFGQCAEFCGVAHANMRFKVVAEPKEEFEAWLLAQAAPAFEPSDPLVQEGQDIFMSRRVLCFRCHTIDGPGIARGTIGPDLTHFASRDTFIGSIRDNTQENLREWLTNPQEVKEGNIMARDAEVYNGTLPALNDRQISALVAYLRSLN